MPDLDQLFVELLENPGRHIPGTPTYDNWKKAARVGVEQRFAGADPASHPFGPFGSLSLPYFRMGAIDSLDLFGLDELIIFAFYHANRGRYHRVVDIGANLGLHSIILGKYGFSVKSFEPDPKHFSILQENLKANHIATAEPIQAAVSTRDGTAEFVRVLGNTTGSHLAGAKSSYGDREFFPVTVRSVSPLFAWADLAKIDAEGHEKEILLAASAADLRHLDIIVEIGSEANARAVFEHFTALGVNMFAQKLGWAKAQSAADLPTSHREGSLFISAKPAMPWSPS
jgi:FkbM family methyltransferase